MIRRARCLAGRFGMALCLAFAPLQAVADVPGVQLAAAAVPDRFIPIPHGAAVTPVLFGIGKNKKRTRGFVCGNRKLQGAPAADIPPKRRGCGLTNGVRVTSVAGVTLSQASLMTCETAEALYKWVDRDVVHAFGRGKKEVVELRVAAHYSCRTRNNRPGAKISEHGRGKAIDISGFRLANGDRITVLKGWEQRPTRRVLRKMWRGACGPFGTVLGPNADRYHRDHFHFDTARHRGGAYCR